MCEVIRSTSILSPDKLHEQVENIFEQTMNLAASNKHLSKSMTSFANIGIVRQSSTATNHDSKKLFNWNSKMGLVPASSAEAIDILPGTQRRSIHTSGPGQTRARQTKKSESASSFFGKSSRRNVQQRQRTHGLLHFNEQNTLQDIFAHSKVLSKIGIEDESNPRSGVTTANRKSN